MSLQHVMHVLLHYTLVHMIQRRLCVIESGMLGSLLGYTCRFVSSYSIVNANIHCNVREADFLFAFSPHLFPVVHVFAIVLLVFCCSTLSHSLLHPLAVESALLIADWM